MAYNIQILESAIKDLSKIDKKQAGRILLAITEKLSKRPADYEFLKGEFKVFRKFRIGDYRIFFKIIKSDVIVYKIRHRRDVYE